MKPIWPGPAQREWIQEGLNLEQHARILLLEEDNKRLRQMLELEKALSSKLISAVVVSKSPQGWWQKLEIGKGSNDGIFPGDAVTAPGGLLGIVQTVTPNTSRVKLLTAPGSRIGVWIAEKKRHGILFGTGSNRPTLELLNKDLNIKPGDLVSTSPSSSILPPNILIGVVQSINYESLPAPKAIVQLSAEPAAIDWVQVHKK
tara:strand:+ start:318 stop:923 length:606 start_codon:yes stop_codon:yes gene_type:complete